MSEDQARDIQVRAATQRGRVLREIFGSAEAARNSRYDVSPVEVVASFRLPAVDPAADEDGVLDEITLTRLIAAQAGAPFKRIDPLELEAELITKTLSRPFATRHVVLPLQRIDDTVVVALHDPFDAELIENLRRLTGCQVRAVVSTKTEILKSIAEVYGFQRSVSAAARDAQRSSEVKTVGDIGNLEQLIRLKSIHELEATDKHIVAAVDYLLRSAFDQRASDIHVEPKREQLHVRLRIDGVLHLVHRLPKEIQNPFTARLKMMSRMDISEKRRPQDGRIKMGHGEREIELRVSTLPVAFGEKMVIRIFDPDVELSGLADLGFEPEELDIFGRWIERPHGLILVTGPTGSGKSTTLYTALSVVSTAEVNVVTIEDPIEMVREELNQVAVQQRLDITFASVLRTILRQDPDVIMVGEIRDGETAANAIQSALTGHLVLSTLHTNDAPTAVTRMLDLGVEPFLLADTLIGVMAQRLLRLVCQECKQSSVMTADQCELLGVDEPHEAFEGAGCASCRGTGLYGRSGVFELLSIDTPLRQLIGQRAPAERIFSRARETGMQTLRESALRLLRTGGTSVGEVLRLTVDS